jgi:hypothetical protein
METSHLLSMTTRPSLSSSISSQSTLLVAYNRQDHEKLKIDLTNNNNNKNDRTFNNNSDNYKTFIAPPNDDDIETN